MSDPIGPIKPNVHDQWIEKRKLFQKRFNLGCQLVAVQVACYVPRPWGPIAACGLLALGYDVENSDPEIHWRIKQDLDKYGPVVYPPGMPMPPVALDLKGSGRIDTLNVNDGVYFDYYGDGFGVATGWVSPDAGILVMDRNGNGVLDNGSELFGSLTPLPSGQPAADGYQALAALDSNHDGKIDAQDPAYSLLRVWADPSGKGNWEQGVVYTLAELDIESIDLNWTTVNTTDAQGNIVLTKGSFQKTDGSTGLIADYGFQVEPYYTFPMETLPVPDDIAALADVPASGLVYDLRQAMVRDTSGRLQALVKQFAAENDPNVPTALMDQILFQWTGSEDIDPNSRGGSIDARKLAVVEAWFGKPWLGAGGPNPSYEAAVYLNEAYRRIFEDAYAHLMGQSHLKDLYDRITYRWFDEKQEYDFDMSGLIAELQTQLANDPEQGKLLLSEFARTMRGLGSGAESTGLCC